MVTDEKTHQFLQKIGFYPIDCTFDVEWWVIPISGRILMITNTTIYRPIQALKNFGGVQIPFDTFDAFITNLCGQINETEHQLIDTILTHA